MGSFRDGQPDCTMCCRVLRRLLGRAGASCSLFSRRLLLLLDMEGSTGHDVVSQDAREPMSYSIHGSTSMCRNPQSTVRPSSLEVVCEAFQAEQDLLDLLPTTTEAAGGTADGGPACQGMSILASFVARPSSLKPAELSWRHYE